MGTISRDVFLLSPEVWGGAESATEARTDGQGYIRSVLSRPQITYQIVQRDLSQKLDNLGRDLRLENWQRRTTTTPTALFLTASRKRGMRLQEISNSFLRSFALHISPSTREDCTIWFRQFGVVLLEAEIYVMMYAVEAGTRQLAKIRAHPSTPESLPLKHLLFLCEVRLLDSKPKWRHVGPSYLYTIFQAIERHSSLALVHFNLFINIKGGRLSFDLLPPNQCTCSLDQEAPMYQVSVKIYPTADRRTDNDTSLTRALNKSIQWSVFSRAITAMSFDLSTRALLAKPPCEVLSLDAVNATLLLWSSPLDWQRQLRVNRNNLASPDTGHVAQLNTALYNRIKINRSLPLTSIHFTRFINQRPHFKWIFLKVGYAEIQSPKVPFLHHSALEIWTSLQLVPVSYWSQVMLEIPCEHSLASILLQTLTFWFKINFRTTSPGIKKCVTKGDSYKWYVLVFSNTERTKERRVLESKVDRLTSGVTGPCTVNSIVFVLSKVDRMTSGVTGPCTINSTVFVLVFGNIERSKVDRMTSGVTGPCTINSTVFVLVFGNIERVKYQREKIQYLFWYSATSNVLSTKERRVLESKVDRMTSGVTGPCTINTTIFVLEEVRCNHQLADVSGLVGCSVLLCLTRHGTGWCGG
ncbi:hypothetical protein J6590_050002 [Homalodisca vitripennis]|nr:hypothetical protein J6590_050002 [Homalodisca vitripennis]